MLAQSAGRRSPDNLTPFTGGRKIAVSSYLQYQYAEYPVSDLFSGRAVDRKPFSGFLCRLGRRCTPPCIARHPFGAVATNCSTTAAASSAAVSGRAVVFPSAREGGLPQ